MTQHNHQTAPTQFVEANGIRFAYRRFGKTGGAPLVFNQHFRGTMDYWDPAVTDGLAKNREVILFNNAGVSSSSGKVPASIQQMGANAIAFIGALGLDQGRRARLFHRRHGRSGNRSPGAGSRSPAHSGRRRAARRRHVDEQIRGDLCRRLRSARASLACGSLLAVPFGPGRRPRFSETQASPQGSRSRGERGSRSGAARSHRQIYRARRGRSRLSERYPSADADRAGQQRRHHALR